MKAIHFGAGNIGRGFIGLQLVKTGYEVCFVDVNTTVVDALKARNTYEVGYASEQGGRERVDGVTALNSLSEPDQVIAAIREADVITTAVGPSLLSKVAPLIAEGLSQRGSQTPVYIIACENMIGGSKHLQGEVAKHHPIAENWYFPNAAVDRIVPLQHHEDPLYVEVEEFFEWVIETTGLGSVPTDRGRNLCREH
ncbi:hypothetical protein OVA29_09245 [Exiguobacterium sp. SL14]|nr:hypothetical protein [Exiguobacterium sp. SL14]MCY1690829.1 hypothetical protein [Exiguobacterium sp. SL14]